MDSISDKIKLVFYIDFKDFNEEDIKEARPQLSRREKLKDCFWNPSHISTHLFEHYSTKATHWAEAYDRRQKRRDKLKWVISAVASIFVGTAVWFFTICKTAWDKNKASYMLDPSNIPSYSIMTICITIGLVLYYIYYRLSSTELIENIRKASQQTNLNTLNTFRLLDTSGIKENLIAVLKLIFDPKNNTKFHKYNGELCDIEGLRKSIIKILDIGDFKESKSSNSYTLNITLDKFNKLLGVLIEKNYYYFIDQEKTMSPKQTIILDLLKEAFEQNPPVYCEKIYNNY